MVNGSGDQLGLELVELRAVRVRTGREQLGLEMVE